MRSKKEGTRIWISPIASHEGNKGHAEHSNMSVHIHVVDYDRKYAMCKIPCVSWLNRKGKTEKEILAQFYKLVYQISHHLLHLMFRWTHSLNSNLK